MTLPNNSKTPRFTDLLVNEQPYTYVLHPMVSRKVQQVVFESEDSKGPPLAVRRKKVRIHPRVEIDETLYIPLDYVQWERDVYDLDCDEADHESDCLEPILDTSPGLCANDSGIADIVLDENVTKKFVESHVMNGENRYANSDQSDDCFDILGDDVQSDNQENSLQDRIHEKAGKIQKKSGQPRDTTDDCGYNLNLDTNSARSEFIKKFLSEPHGLYAKPKKIEDLSLRLIMEAVFSEKWEDCIETAPDKFTLLLNDPNLIFLPTEKRKTKARKYNLSNDRHYNIRRQKRVETLSVLGIQHSPVALELSDVFYRADISRDDLMAWHRPYISASKLIMKETNLLYHPGARLLLEKSMSENFTPENMVSTRKHVDLEEHKKIDISDEFKQNDSASRILYETEHTKKSTCGRAIRVDQGSMRDNELLVFHQDRKKGNKKFSVLPSDQFTSEDLAMASQLSVIEFCQHLTATETFRTPSDLSLISSGSVCLVEYLEERPLVLGKGGMASLICAYASQDYSEPLGLPIVEPPRDNPFIPEKPVYSISNNLYRALLYHQPVKVFICTISTTNFDKESKIANTTETTTYSAISSRENSLFNAPKGSRMQNTTQINSELSSHDLNPRERNLSPMNICTITKTILFAASQIQPLEEIYSPHSKSANSFCKSRLRIGAGKMAQGHTVALKMKDLDDRFPTISEGLKRKWLREFAEKRRDNSYLLNMRGYVSEDDLPPESVCLYEAMLLGELLLKEGMCVPDESPWNLSRNFMKGQIEVERRSVKDVQTQKSVMDGQKTVQSSFFASNSRYNSPSDSPDPRFAKNQRSFQDMGNSNHKNLLDTKGLDSRHYCAFSKDIGKNTRFVTSNSMQSLGELQNKHQTVQPFPISNPHISEISKASEYTQHPHKINPQNTHSRFPPTSTHRPIRSPFALKTAIHTHSAPISRQNSLSANFRSSYDKMNQPDFFDYQVTPHNDPSNISNSNFRNNTTSSDKIPARASTDENQIIDIALFDDIDSETQNTDTQKTTNTKPPNSSESTPFSYKSGKSMAYFASETQVEETSSFGRNDALHDNRQCLNTLSNDNEPLNNHEEVAPTVLESQPDSILIQNNDNVGDIDLEKEEINLFTYPVGISYSKGILEKDTLQRCLGVLDKQMTQRIQPQHIPEYLLYRLRPYANALSSQEAYSQKQDEHFLKKNNCQNTQTKTYNSTSNPNPQMGDKNKQHREGIKIIRFFGNKREEEIITDKNIIKIYMKERQKIKREEKKILIKCSKCGEIGHMKTNKACRFYEGEKLDKKNREKEFRRKRNLLTDNILKTLYECFKIPLSNAFHKPVNTKRFTNYLEKVKTPIDLGTMKNRARVHFYKTYKAFLSDLILMHENCVTYNGDEHPFSKISKQMIDLAHEVYNQNRDLIRIGEDAIAHRDNHQ